MAKKHKNQTTPQTDNNTDELRARKKAAVVGTSEKKSGFLLPSVIAVLIVAGVAGGYMVFSGKPDGPVTAVDPNTSKAASHAVDNQVSYPVAMFDDGQARHFEFKDGEHTIRYFVIQSADGVLRAAFDACDVCWPAGEGYYQEGNVMVCRNCGQRFAADKVNDVKGGCNPAPLTRRVEGDRLVIEADDIRAGRGYFDFKGKA